MILIKKNIILISIFTIIIYLLRIYDLSIVKNNYYNKLLLKQTSYYTYGLSAPRGRILDRNGNILVDNKKVRVITYQKNKHISSRDEINIAKKLSKYLDNEYVISNDEIANYLIKENGIENYIDKEDYNKYLNSILTYNDIYSKAVDNINKEKLYVIDEDLKKTAKIYSLMNKDYSYDIKIIFKNISDEKYFKIINDNIKGVSGSFIYEREYKYNDLLKSLYGSVGKISKDNLNEYLNKGYSINDTVGTSYLEKEYENLLKGKKAKYKVNNDGTLKKIENEIKGEDLYLNIDINIEEKLYQILSEKIKNTKGKTNTEYYNGSYVIVGNPNGEIVALLGLKLINNDLYENTIDIVNYSFTPGSIVKAASNTVGYHENIIIPDKKINDSCVKLYLNTEKCSYKKLGLVDDITALEKSSNYYQYINALKVMGYDKYKYNMKVNVTNKSFDKYRNIFKSYGLGDYTYIDLPSESLGITGKIVSPDLLLNLSIGQYDSYTPLQIFSYINTLASKGKRYNIRLNRNLDKKLVNEVDISESNLNRILTGLNNVVSKGTGKGYIFNNDGAGKTGTSETLVDTNNDGIYETKTISTAFIGYAPFDNPKYTFVVISPNISSNKDKNNYKVPINRYIINDLTSFLFEN